MSRTTLLTKLHTPIEIDDASLLWYSISVSRPWIAVIYCRRNKYLPVHISSNPHTSQLHKKLFTDVQLEQQQHSSNSARDDSRNSRHLFKPLKDYKMSSLPSPYECDDPSCKDPTCLDLQITPHFTSEAVTIPYPTGHPKYELPKNLPPILRKRNADAGLAKIPRKDILEYIPVHYERTPKPSNARFAKTNPIRLGLKLPPGFGPKPPPRKDLGFEIVPDDTSPRHNKRARNQWQWQRQRQRKELEEEVERMKGTAQQAMEEDVRKREGSKFWPGGRKVRLDSVMSTAISFV